MRARASILATAVCLGLVSASRIWAGMQAPQTVQAGVGGHFEYQWIFVVEQPLLIAGLGWSDELNTNGALHGDCFCDARFCAAQPGDTIRWQVFGNLVDTTVFGRARNWVADCGGSGGGQSSTLIMPAKLADVGDPGLDTRLRFWSQPNPCRRRASLNYVLPAQGWVSLRLYDPMGRRVATLVDGVESAGAKSVAWESPGLGTTRMRGLYFARLEFSGQVRTARVIIID